MALQLLAANNAQSVLAAGISASATSLTLNTGTGALFPAPVSGTSFFKLTLIDAATGQLTEIVHVTARTGDTLTIDRAQEGTLARAWSANDIAANMMTAGTLSYIMSNLQPLDATLTALAGLATGANKLPYFTGTDTAGQTDLTSVGRDIIGKNTIAEILTYLTLKSAAQRDVGTGTNQIPDMTSFTAGPGWMKFPSGKIIQYGYQTSSASGAIIVNFPIPFPTQCYGVTGAGTDSNAANIGGCQVIDRFGFNLSAWLVGSGVFNRTATNISWISVGI